MNIIKKTICVFLLSGTVIAVSAQKARYELKSAVIKKETAVMGQKFEAMWYFDDFGLKESVEITVKNGIIEGVDKHVRTIVDSVSMTNVDLDLRQAQKIILPEKPLNYLQLTPEIIEKYKIKETGEETVAGKTCKKYSMEVSQMGQTLKVTNCIWKGLVLKTETSGGGMLISAETVIEIQENVPVPADKFTIPEGFIVL
jgi:outer membrane lipoprotein-sorting protein